MGRWEKRDQDLYMKAGDNHMKINIGNHEFTELWDGVLYKALSDYPNVSDNEMKDIIELPDTVLQKEDRNAANDPTDFFHYVMFSWGNCQAGDRLVMERKLGRSPSPDEMSAGFTPGVRFYFKYDDLDKHPQAVHDGFLPVKVKDEVKLADYVYMIVIPFEYKDQIMKVMPEKLSDRAFCLSPDELDVWQWSEKVYSFVHDMAKSNVN